MARRSFIPKRELSHDKYFLFAGKKEARKTNGDFV